MTNSDEVIDLMREIGDACAKLDYHGFAPAEGQTLGAAIDTALSKLIHEKAELADEIERLTAAIKRIDAINDNPARFSVEIHEVCRLLTSGYGK